MAICRRRWLEAQTPNLDEDLAGSGLMSEGDHLIIEKLTALLFYNAHSLLTINGNMRHLNNNKLKIHTL